MKKMKHLVFLLGMLLCFLLASCGQEKSEDANQNEAQTQASSEGETASDDVLVPERLTIGVTVYNTADPEVLAFRNYFEGYIKGCFDVDFLYSTGITSLEAELEYIEMAKENGVSGIISFTSQDLEAVVKACEEAGIYYMRGSGSVADEDFNKVKDNPYFIGAVGPGMDMEKEAAKEMAAYFMDAAKNKEEVHYMLLTGGAAVGNAMHKYRSEAILDTLGADPALAV